MSNVTNLIVAHGEGDGKWEEINDFFVANGDAPLVSVDDPKLPDGWYGGSKFLECAVAIGAYNYLNTHEFMEYLGSLTWERPKSVQVFVRAQGDDGFTIHTPCAWKMDYFAQRDVQHELRRRADLLGRGDEEIAVYSQELFNPPIDPAERGGAAGPMEAWQLDEDGMLAGIVRATLKRRRDVPGAWLPD